jgi:hypothetical protein
MLLKPVRAAFLVGLVAAAASTPVRADAPAASGATTTVQVTECVPEYYKTTRTAYRWECRPEKYTAYRCEYKQEQRTRTCTYYERVCEVKDVVRDVCTMVPTVEERVCRRPHYSYVTETKMVCKTVTRGHWECREVYCFARDMQNRFGRLGHHRNDCCDPCHTTCCEAPTRMKKVWVTCRQTVQCPVTCCRKVCTYTEERVKVTVCRPVHTKQVCKVNCYRCVPRTRVETYTCCVPHRVAVECVRNVRVCVPYQETVTCCRMVARVVTRQVPACVSSACCSNLCCNEPCCSRRVFRGGLFSRRHGGCDSGCGSGCGGCH